MALRHRYGGVRRSKSGEKRVKISIFVRLRWWDAGFYVLHKFEKGLNILFSHKKKHVDLVTRPAWGGESLNRHQNLTPFIICCDGKIPCCTCAWPLFYTSTPEHLSNADLGRKWRHFRCRTRLSGDAHICKRFGVNRRVEHPVTGWCKKKQKHVFNNLPFWNFSTASPALMIVQRHEKKHRSCRIALWM